jgi:hypothetical protein
VFIVCFLNRGQLTCVLECLHILYTCSLAVRPWLPQFCHHCRLNLPLKPVPPTPVVHLCERVRWTVAMVSAVLSSPSPVMCTHVGPGLPKLVEWVLAVGADSPLIRNLSNVLQQSVCPFRGLVIPAGIDWPCRSETRFTKKVLNSYKHVQFFVLQKHIKWP